MAYLTGMFQIYIKCNSETSQGYLRYIYLVYLRQSIYISQTYLGNIFNISQAYLAQLGHNLEISRVIIPYIFIRHM